SIVDRDLIAPDLRITLTCAQTRADAEVQRQLIKTGDIGGPLRVDEDVLERAAASRTFDDRATARTETPCLVRRRSGRNALGRILLGVRAVVLRSVVVSHVSSEDPSIVQTICGV